MQQYFVPEENWQAESVTVSGDDVHHINRVVRLKAEDEIICSHPAGHAARCIIASIESDAVHATVIEWLDNSVELPVDVTIAQGLPKGDKLDLIIQKGTELGAKAFIPVQAKRSVVKWDDKKRHKKKVRFEKIAKEASEQSHRNLIPQIKTIMSLSELIDESNQYDVKIFAYEEEAKTTNYQSFSTILQGMKEGQKLLVLIGPEGGISEDEAAQLKESEFSPVRLGPRILRTETAALYMLASVSYHFEELRWNECQQ
ncbi:16S rRNA (uracil(1498)-N(3))-methyltransferase [Oceanobacillus jordanicus]|uniref:Ribosomal RNA small subunit methyltransferase E n=1 Tax=Oceanobacillus jordanicus TaxID=2867266 RepID=A0AAW5B331_9BACI|nr:16S rRNA (uracil(1498)-N(3))-methyltransferase [Oceanobacillus jordanicus]